MRHRIIALGRRANEVLPTGTAVVGAGIAVSALASYVFVVIALNSLEGSAKAAFSAFWAVIFVVGPGFFLPLEQEVGRAIARRRAQGIGGRPVAVRAAQIGAVITVVLIVLAIALTPVLTPKFYGGDPWFTLSLCIALVAFFGLHTVRGILAGENRFNAYGELVAMDAIVRLVLAVGLRASGTDSGSMFALCLGLSPLITIPFVLRGARRELAPGPEAPVAELSVNLGWLLGASVLMQALAYSPLLGVNILSTASEEAIVTGFASAFFVARVPVLMFQAVQGTLLPKLAGLAGSGRHDEFRRGVIRLLALVGVIAVVGTVASFLIGPTIGRMLFKDFTMESGMLALLAAGSGIFIIALTIAQALMALGGLRACTLSWAAGFVVSSVVIAVIADLELRVDLGLIAGATVAAVSMGVVLYRSQGRMVDADISTLVEAIEQEPIEI